MEDCLDLSCTVIELNLCLISCRSLDFATELENIFTDKFFGLLQNM